MKNVMPLEVVERELLFDVNGFTAQLCCSEESKQIAYALRYESYLHAGVIQVNKDGCFFDDYDQQTNTRTHLIWHEGVPVASVRSCIWSEKYAFQPVESIENFRSAVKKKIGLEQNILESSRYVIAPGFNRRKSLFAQLLMFRIQDLSSVHDDCENIVTSVRQRHATFYHRMLAFDQISEAVQHDFIDAEIVLLRTFQKESRAVITQKGMPVCTPEEVDRYAELASQLSA